MMEEKIFEEIQGIEKALETKFVARERIDEILKTIATKEEVEAIRSELATYKTLAVNKHNKDVKKDVAEYFKKTITTTSGGASFTLRDEVADEVMTLANIYGIARRLSTVMTMETQTMKIPVEGTVSTYWVGEATDITETSSTNAFGTGVNITLKKLAGYVEVSRELLRFANVSVVDYLIQQFAKEIAKEEDRIFLRGNTGAGDPFNGIEYTTPSSSIVLPTGATSWNAIEIDHLIKIQSEVHPSVVESADATYILHPKLFYEHILTKKGTDNHYQLGVYASLIDKTLLGKRVVLSDQMPPNNAGRVAVIFGDFKKANVFAIGQELTIETSMEFKFREDSVAIKLTELVSPVALGLRSAYSYVKLASA